MKLFSFSFLVVFSGVFILSAVSSCNKVEADWFRRVETNSIDNGFGLPVSAAAEFNFDSGSNQLSVQLYNLIQDQRSVNQNVSGLFVSFSTLESTGVEISSSGFERFVASDGSFIDDGSTIPIGWSLTSDAIDPLFGKTGVHLDLLTSPIAPLHTIIGSPDVENNYSNANNSITGNGSHNPFLRSGATFVLGIDGLSDSSRIETVTFQFNTTIGTYSGVSEPSTFVFLTLAIIGGLWMSKGRTRIEE
jgi:hypothetical protein